ncbi:translation factor Sua5 [Methanocalculus chunghsingensis]|uniref:L-threonylcarbamoyladenylate synthase n=1 Tax=Methanocalculus chunghsingensis TaxID=156457 RepID=A0A8J7W4F7_9EURY|nr:L-threonylcarbamoyladenylate synthase [Methanocalculus chunghsingensis]MBR1368011.1 translation factor Sua5 [Methanocalculus chunghsingensis]
MDDIIQRAVSVLRRDGIIVYPTDTIYGLGGDAFSDIAIERVYEAKNRLRGKPISIAISDIEMLACVAYIDKKEMGFINRFLPGPVTVILEAKKCVPDELTGGTGKIGIRWPDHKIALTIIRELDAPITATSANISGEISPRRISEVNVRNDLVVDGGELPGTPSTVVDLHSKEIIRPGSQLDEIVDYLIRMG